MPYRRNSYRCAVEVTQAGKYCVRVQAFYGHSRWTLPVYFLVSSPATALRRLAQSIEELHRAEERLRFWGVEHSDDPELIDELLTGIGLALDRRIDFPATAATIAAAPNRPMPALSLARLKREFTPQFAPLAGERTA